MNPPRGNYKDNALLFPSAKELELISSRGHYRDASDPFPVRLHDLLTELESDVHSEHRSIYWQPHGRAFRIHDKDRFQEEILPKHFNMKKYQSFQRQLNLYSFSRITYGSDQGCYYHENFLRGKLFLAYRIKRTKVKNEGYRKSADLETEPNFSLYIPMLNPLHLQRQNPTTYDRYHAGLQEPLTGATAMTVSDGSANSFQGATRNTTATGPGYVTSGSNNQQECVQNAGSVLSDTRRIHQLFGSNINGHLSLIGSTVNVQGNPHRDHISLFPMFHNTLGLQHISRTDSLFWIAQDGSSIMSNSSIHGSLESHPHLVERSHRPLNDRLEQPSNLYDRIYDQSTEDRRIEEHGRSTPENEPERDHTH